MKILFKTALIFLFTVSAIYAQSQNKLNSLFSQLKNCTNDSCRADTYLDIGYYFEATDLEKAFQYYDSAQTVAQLNLPEFSMSNAKKYFAQKKSFKNEKSYLKIFERSLRYKGIVNYYQSNLPLALKNYQNSLLISELLGEKAEISKCYTNIGLVQQSFKKEIIALDYYTKALDINRSLGDKYGELNNLNQIGGVYIRLKNYKKALLFLEEFLKISEQLNDKIEKSVCLGNIGTIYKNLKNFPKALEYYQKSLDTDLELKDSLNISISLNQIGILYGLLGNTSKSIEFSRKSLAVALNIGFKETIKYASKNLIECYSKQGNYKECYNYFLIYNEVKDSIYNENSSRQLNEMEVRFQTEKKQKEIELLYKDKQLQSTEIKRQTTQKYAFISGFLLMLIITFLAVFSYRKIKDQKKLIQEKNEVLYQQNEEITAQRDEIELQRDTVTNQKNHIEEIHKEITDSINYAKRIQHAVFPDLSDTPKNVFIKNLEKESTSIWGGFNDVFILFRPKDVVSGDFYWATRINEWLIIAVADCTGHGVPGAFMSMLGISFLNEIVRKKEVVHASQVLDQLRASVVDALNQQGSYGEQKDGMDIALVILNTVTLECQFAGANNPLWLVPFEQVESFTELIEIKPDKMPVAIYDNMNPFSNHIIKLCKGDIIYLASDGFEDQFGGPKNKKFLSKNMKELIKSISNKSMAEQKIILETKLIEWIGNGEQIDDVTVLGLKI